MNSVELDLSVAAAPLRSDLLGFALATSPLRSTLEPVVARHRAHVRNLAARQDAFAVQGALTAATARLASRDDVGAVLLPHQEDRRHVRGRDDPAPGPDVVPHQRRSGR